jgi:hypothetical protein
MERPSREGEFAIISIRRKNVDQINTLERVFSYKAKANSEILATMRQFDHASPAKEIAIRILSHTYAVDRIFAANLTGTEHGYTSPNPGQAQSIEELSAAIKTSDQWYINYVSLLAPLSSSRLRARSSMPPPVASRSRISLGRLFPAAPKAQKP